VFESRHVFADGLHNAMNITVLADGTVIVAERGRVIGLWDRDGDGVAEQRKDLLTLSSTFKHPHDGIGSIAPGPNGNGWLYVGVGENGGAAYELRGSDGRVYRGDGEGGNVFRCRSDGSQLERYATGFWNPFGLAARGDGSVFAADNDAETRPPNRLLDVIRGADFGFRSRYGDAAEHPFQSWNGELPGTLPMMGVVGEAATSVLPTDGLTWPSTYGGKVLVSSWADRRIEVHTMIPQGSTFTSDLQILVQGGDDFRPVALAAARDGSVFFTDWVKREYAVHGFGRIWRLTPRKRWPPLRAQTLSRARKDMLMLSQTSGAMTPKLLALARSAAHRDPFMVTAATTALANEPGLLTARLWVAGTDPELRFVAFMALKEARRHDPADLPDAAQIIHEALVCSDVRLRTLAMIWGYEAKLLSRQDEVLLERSARIKPQTAQLLATYRAACAFIGCKPPLDLQEPEANKSFAQLRDAKGYPSTIADLQKAMWTFASQPFESGWATIELLAHDRKYADVLRADAIGILAMHGQAKSFTTLLSDPSLQVRTEAVRALRSHVNDATVVAALKNARARAEKTDTVFASEVSFALDPGTQAGTPRPETDLQWWTFLAAKPGNPDAGRRAFVHPGVACNRCHRVGSLGNNVGPPLTFIGGERPHRLLESLLHPSVDIVWSARQFETRDGQSHIGMVKGRGKDGGIKLVNGAGQAVTLSEKDIVSETKSDASLMPDGLFDTMSLETVRDLFSFLRHSTSTHPFDNQAPSMRPLETRANISVSD